MFGQWLIDQQQRKDDVGKFARLCWEDHTSGCARYYSGAVEWRDHFESKHADKVELIFPLLKAAFIAYVDDMPG